jgi:hypothetical protein
MNKYTFIIWTSKHNSFSKTHWCHNDHDARQQLQGMVYAIGFTHKNHFGQVWCNNSMVAEIH